VYKTFIIKRKV